MQPLHYLQTTDGMIWTAVCVLLGFVLTALAYFMINRIPARWLCDYHEEPSAELLSGKRVKYVGSGLVLSVIASFSLVMCRLQFNKGYDIYFIVFALIIMIALMIAVCDIKYTIIPDQFTIAIAVLALMITVYDLVRGFGLLHTSWWQPLLGAVIGAGGMILIDLIGMLIYKKTGMGFGDVKLFAAIGLLTGFPGTFYAYAIAFVSATICFCIIMILVRILAGRERKKAASSADATADGVEQPVQKTALQEEASAGTEETSEKGQSEDAAASDEKEPGEEAPETGEEPSEEQPENDSGSYLAFGPYIAVSVICYIVFYDFIHQLVEMYLHLF